VRSLLPIVLVSCSGSDGLPADVLTPVDCTNLPPAPEELVQHATSAEAVLLDADLATGTGQILLGWSEDGAEEQWFLTAPREGSPILFAQGIDDLPVWHLRIKIPCLPESATNVQWTRDGAKSPLTPGAYPLVSVSFDVPEREQTADQESQELSGDIVITKTADGRVSGYLQGWGGGAIYSNFTQEDLGVRYEVAAMKFEQISSDFVAKP
jgi:hypothetical protein